MGRPQPIPSQTLLQLEIEHTFRRDAQAALNVLRSTERFSPRIIHFIQWLNNKQLVSDEFNDGIHIRRIYETMTERKKMEAILILLKFDAFRPAAQVFESLASSNRSQFLLMANDKMSHILLKKDIGKKRSLDESDEPNSKRSRLDEEVVEIIDDEKNAASAEIRCAEDVQRAREHLVNGETFDQLFVLQLISSIAERTNCLETAKFALALIEKMPQVKESLREFCLKNTTAFRRKLQKLFN